MGERHGCSAWDQQSVSAADWKHAPMRGLRQRRFLGLPIVRREEHSRRSLDPLKRRRKKASLLSPIPWSVGFRVLKRRMLGALEPVEDDGPDNSDERAAGRLLAMGSM